MLERSVPFVVVGLLLLTIPLAASSVIIAGAVGLAVVGLLVLALVGLERASTMAMVGAFFVGSWDRFVVPGVAILSPSDALFLIAMVLAMPRLIHQRLWVPPAFLIGAIVFTTFAVLSCLNAESPGESSYYAARVVLTMVVIPALLVWWSPRGRVLVALAVAYAAGNAISIVAGLPDMGGWRNYGLSQHPNILGYTAVLAMALLPFLTRALPKQHRTWICLGILAAVGVGIMTSGSRAALVVAIVLVVLYPAAEKSILAGLAIVASGVAGMVIIGQRGTSANSENALDRLLGAGEVEGSNQARIEGMEQVWSEAVDNPFFGTGFAFVDFLGHNAYLQLAAAAGFISLAAFLVILWSMVTPLFVHDDIHSRLVYPAIAVIVVSPVSPNLTDRYIGLMLGLALTGVVAVREGRLRRGLDESAAVPVHASGTGARLTT